MNVDLLFIIKHHVYIRAQFLIGAKGYISFRASISGFTRCTALLHVNESRNNKHILDYLHFLWIRLICFRIFYQNKNEFH